MTDTGIDIMTKTHALTRAEMKAVTRQRLLEAAWTLLAAEGETALTTTNITQSAGIAQPSFYTHFADVDELLEELAEQMRARRRRTRDARAKSRSAPHDAERLRETFRIPLTNFANDPSSLRVLLRAQHHDSPMGEWSRGVLEDGRRELIADLVTLGFPDRTPKQRRAVEMIADGVIALTYSLALGHVEGRYPDIEEVIDILVAFSSGYFALLRRPDRRSAGAVAGRAVTTPAARRSSGGERPRRGVRPR